MKTNWILWTYGCLCGNMVTPEGGSALADVLFGEVNPGGRIPLTFPSMRGQVPLFYNDNQTGRGDDCTDLAWPGAEMNPVVEPSTVNVMFGSSSDDIRGTGSFAITRPGR